MQLNLKPVVGRDEVPGFRGTEQSATMQNGYSMIHVLPFYRPMKRLLKVTPHLVRSLRFLKFGGLLEA
jgi:hypothetical protein